VSSVDERLEAFYASRAAEEPADDPEALLRFDKALAAAELRPGERVLDLGAKWGGLGLRAREARAEVEYTGLDLSEENCRKAAALGLQVRNADLTARLPVGDAAFDCVFCLELLEHLTTPVALVEEIRRVLVADGRAVISVPSPYSWVEVYRELFGRHDPEGHLNSFTTPVMRNVVGLAGFRLERTLGTSIRIPRTLRLISTNSILARSRIYVIRPADDVVFAGRGLGILG
jgi:cyclopropane fatty-acyl-phospholipid synthase-like methyltransferase